MEGGAGDNDFKAGEGQERRIAANAAKTQAIVFGAGKLPPVLRFLDTDILWRPQVKYLGVTLDRRLSLRKHAIGAAGRASAATAKLRPLLESRLPTRAKLALYRQYIRPHLTYAAPAWYGLTSESSRQRLRAVQNKALRRIVLREKRDHRPGPPSGEPRRLHPKTGDADVRPCRRFAHLRDIAPHHTRPPDHRRASQFSPHPAENPARVTERERAVAAPEEDAIFFSLAVVRTTAQRLKPRKASATCRRAR
ncbi:unnamed protein product [Leptosia nina]|uniref:RNA-directed DNA polymerase from mobile element jockey n=1 Tax=Leptosia nina TaxID=320188 RepID=A0AAV1K632_9NEOP